MTKERLIIAVPCYNEEEALPETARQMGKKLQSLIAAGAVEAGSRILFIDDGSKDQTWQIIEKLHGGDALFSGLKLTRNRGHQNALLAGLMTAKEKADIVISIDADLQDDINVFDAMLAERAKGADVVYGVRGDRTGDTGFKRGTAQGFYRLMKALGVELVYNHADCRLMSRRALEGLAAFPEVNLFLRGMVPLVGYPSAIATYRRGERLAGESKYPLGKMLSFAWEGVTSCSDKPLRFIAGLGLAMAAGSAAVSLYSLLAWLLAWPWRGVTPLMGSLWFLAGLQLAALGVVGQYVGKAYAEAKRRPRYLIETVLD